MSGERRLRIGIIGLGIGMRHASSFALVPEAEIVAMADPAPNRLPVSVDEFCAHYGATYYRDGFEMIERERARRRLDLHQPDAAPAARRGGGPARACTSSSRSRWPARSRTATR